MYCEICFRYVFIIWWIIIYADCNLEERNFYIWHMRNVFLIDWLTKCSNINWNYKIIEMSVTWILFESKSLNHWHPKNSGGWLKIPISFLWRWAMDHCAKCDGNFAQLFWQSRRLSCESKKFGWSFFQTKVADLTRLKYYSTNTSVNVAITAFCNLNNIPILLSPISPYCPISGMRLLFHLRSFNNWYLEHSRAWLKNFHQVSLSCRHVSTWENVSVILSW